jgi:hypothetical protein
MIIDIDNSDEEEDNGNTVDQNFMQE